MSKEYTNSGVEVRYPIDAIATEQARVIMENLVPQWAEEFLEKNRKYKAVDNSLGAKGVFPDIYRKVGILKSRMWDGEQSVGEGTTEVIRDLIGHLFLMAYMLDCEEEETWLQKGMVLDRAADREWSLSGKEKEKEKESPYDPKRSAKEQLEAAWSDGYVAADNGLDDDNPYSEHKSRPEMTVSERLEADGGRH
jgi:hypothetical protein